MIRQSHVMLFASATLLAAAMMAGCATPATTTPAPAPAYPYNSAQRLEQLDRMAMQVVRGTASAPESDYQSRIRPRLPRQLARLGFTAEETAQILKRVDEARADRQRMRHWWAGVTSDQPQVHARR